MPTSSYSLTNLQGHEKLLDEITQLEHKLKKELGEQVALIAYSPEQQSNGSTASAAREL
ncbi:hypothetical protein [Gorillibacterium massiliense]|uniref:hypothetical protein n=1 Tax=Gorillibacterium massiliense TaxID=1280390 RepID=UPI0004B3EAD5|nr:hypothetical protein [Gorillibacterium massiliense]